MEATAPIATDQKLIEYTVAIHVAGGQPLSKACRTANALTESGDVPNWAKGEKFKRLVLKIRQGNFGDGAIDNLGLAEQLMQIAGSDFRELFDDEGTPLPPKSLPDGIASCVKECRLNAKGYHEYKLYDKNTAINKLLELWTKNSDRTS